MFKLASLFSFQKWALVKTIKINHSAASYVYHIHLYESNTGKRKAEYRCDGNYYNIDRKDGWLKMHDIYQLQVYRWLAGRHDPDIPRYSQIAEDDTVNYLKGSV